jgi:hypothetical protein
MKRNRVLIFLVVLLAISLACGLFGSGSSDSDNTAPSVGDSQPSGSTSSGSTTYNTEFPLPPNVDNFADLGDGAINYQTPMALTDVVVFYRDAFKSTGYVERDITTVINDTTFSIVWDGHPSGKAIVVQGVDLGNGTVNVNVRFEDV